MSQWAWRTEMSNLERGQTTVRKDSNIKRQPDHDCMSMNGELSYTIHIRGECMLRKHRHTHIHRARAKLVGWILVVGANLKIELKLIIYQMIMMNITQLVCWCCRGVWPKFCNSNSTSLDPFSAKGYLNPGLYDSYSRRHLSQGTEEVKTTSL